MVGGTTLAVIETGSPNACVGAAHQNAVTIFFFPPHKVIGTGTDGLTKKRYGHSSAQELDISWLFILGPPFVA
jgi:hypothetical protein